MNILWQVIISRRQSSLGDMQLLLAELATLTQTACLWAGRYNKMYDTTDAPPYTPIPGAFDQWCGNIVQAFWESRPIRESLKERSKDLYKRRFKYTKKKQEVIHLQ